MAFEFQFPNNTSILNAKAYAIFAALQWVKDNNLFETVFFRDSFCQLSALKSPL